MSAKPTPIRCAIYTRKSSDEGLEQSFNSLHAQREACEAYIKAQTHEGWVCVKTAYDDAALSGGTLERPALQRLLADIDAGHIEIIVVYKIDRLTRSLAGFARIVERLDTRQASFVSITQAFNTTTSMGRLTLNVLLSFAQFEREVTGERIRDKIRASKQRGMWMGGTLPLGYELPTDPQTRSLVLNVEEAKTVNLIYKRYLELKSVILLQEWMREQNILSKSRITASGKQLGGKIFGRGALYYLLRNRTYRGSIKCGEGYCEDAHPAIIEDSLFNDVQTLLDSQKVARNSRAKLHISQNCLKGLLFDRDGHPMSPSFAYGKGRKNSSKENKKEKQRYSYYVSSPLQKGQKLSPNPHAIRRIPAPEIENILRKKLIRFLEAEPDTALKDLIKAITRIELDTNHLYLTFDKNKMHRRSVEQLAPHPTNPALGLQTFGLKRHKKFGASAFISDEDTTPLSKPDPVLINALQKAHAHAAAIGWEEVLKAKAKGIVETQDNIETKGREHTNNLSQNSRAPINSYERAIMRLAFLAPDLQRNEFKNLQAN